MKTVSTLQITFENLKKGLVLAPIAVLCVFLAEGAQHLVEWQIGMYQSLEMFKAHQSDTIRLAFGVVKVISILAASYFVSKNLAKAYGPRPRFGSFNRDFIRKSWDISFGIHPILALTIFAIPLIVVHYKLGYLAMGHSWAPFILFVDSLLVALLGLVAGTAMWAGDVINSKVEATA